MKILLATNSTGINAASTDLACYLANLTRSTLTGVFLEEEDGYLIPEVLTVKSELNSCDHCISRFKEACIARETKHIIHRDKGVPLEELLIESRFADVLVIDPLLSFSKYNLENPSGFVKKVLKYAECPVMIAPEQFNEITDLVFTYDGEESSMFAIKQFTYLFPQFSGSDVTILEGNNVGNNNTQKHSIHEWLQDHYTNVTFKTKSGDSYISLLEGTLEEEKGLIVMGAYGRNLLSTLLRQSHSDNLIRSVQSPLFIAHK